MTLAKKTLGVVAAIAGAALALAGCASGNPLADNTTPATHAPQTVVVGSQSYASNTIIAEIYAQALEGDGITVQRKFNIGQRSAYMPAIQSGQIQLFPEYTGNLLQYLNPKAVETAPDDVYAALQKALPANLAVLDKATATDQDSYTVTRAFANKWHLTSIADLANVKVPLVLGGNPELADRPYGPQGLKKIYGITTGFKATGDTTLESLLAGTINIGDIYTSSPAIKTKDLVVLKDPKGMILASNIVPLVNKDVEAKVGGIINAVQAKLTPDALVEMNVENTVGQQSAAQIAKKFLSDNHLK